MSSRRRGSRGVNSGVRRDVDNLGSCGAWPDRLSADRLRTYGSTSDLEGLPEDQPGEHPDQGVPGDRVERRRSRSTSFTASARRASSRSAGARTATARCRTPRSSRATSSRRAATSSCRRKTSTRSVPSRRASSISCSSPTSRRSIRCTSTAPTTSRRTAAMAADAFAVMREGMKGKVGIGKLALYGREYLVAVRPHAARHRDVHAAPRGRNPQHRRGRGAELGAGEGQARGDQAGAAGDRAPSRRRSIWPTTRTSTAKGCSGSSTRRSPARRSSRRPSKRRRRSST